MDNILKTIYNTLDDRKANNINILDISEISIMADYFVIASGTNINQVQALADHLEDELRKLGLHPTHIEGYKQGSWILMDYNNIVLHIFNDEDRAFYDLDHIWSDGKKVSL